ncbi:MAG: hypothetical protein ACI90V_011454, partial [Bacillariaceae sp.]
DGDRRIGNSSSLRIEATVIITRIMIPAVVAMMIHYSNSNSNINNYYCLVKPIFLPGFAEY